jgi:hypothetical protein
MEARLFVIMTAINFKFTYNYSLLGDTYLNYREVRTIF